MSANFCDFPIHVVGIGLDGAAGLTEKSLQQIEAATVLVGSDRQLSYFPKHPGDRWPLKRLLAHLQAPAIGPTESAAHIVVLASGDPLFFGVGRLLLQHLPPEHLVFYPHLSAVQLAFSRVKLPWQDAEVVSAHGRSPDALLAALKRSASKIAVLTDDVTTPNAIARLLVDLGLGDRYQVWVCEALGSQEEQVRRYRPVALAQEKKFAPLNVVILQRLASLPALNTPVVGIDDAQFASFTDRPGLITKKSVRLIALGQLSLQDYQVAWDIGAGTGSVSVEIARLCPHAQVYAIEKSAAGAALIHQNISRFSAPNITPVQGRAPDCLGDLPDPHRIFVGGSDGDLAEILNIAQARLRPDGILVAALATLESMAIANQWLASRHLQTQPQWRHQFLQIQINASIAVGPLTRFAPQNPVTLLTLRRHNKSEN
ncbi:MAG: precorrin-6y C5,15-methyltransferase (decarboxylating) subunit CbiE [Elainellaceae cyanobacterium]